MLIDGQATQQGVEASQLEEALALQVQEEGSQLEVEALALLGLEEEAFPLAEEALERLEREEVEVLLEGVELHLVEGVEEGPLVAEEPALRHPTCAAPCTRSPKAWF